MVDFGSATIGKVPLRVAGRTGFVAGALVCLATKARAEDSVGAGDTDWALPGIVRVGIPTTERRFSAAGSAGYGYLEPQSSSDGSHQRVMGTASAAIAPLPQLAFALRFDGRYDHHPDDGMGAHSGEVGDPRFLARAGTTFGDFRVGGELGLWLPGQTAPSIAFDATTLDARLLGSYVPRSGPTIGILAGFRLDNSAKAISHPELLRFGDRLVLGLSDFDAVLVGAGISVPIQKTELLGELSGDLLVGSGAPKITDSPLRADLGVRHHLNDAFALELLAEASLSARPPVGPTDPLSPIEPRLSVIGGIRYTLPFDRPAEPAPAKPVAPAPVVVAAPVAPKSASVVIHVVGEDGAAIANATVSVKAGAAVIAATSANDGTYRAADVLFGDATISVAADGFVAVEQPLVVSAQTTAPVDVKLEAAPVSGQLRGLVRTFGGKGIPASIRVEPLGKEAKADAQGSFTIDVPPGDYEVVIQAPHFRVQKSKIHVDQNGVTVLNAELFEGK